MNRPKMPSDIDFNWSDDPKTLRGKYKQTDFDSIFSKLIAKDVILTMSPQLVPEPHNLIYDDKVVHKNLIAPLEEFICDSDDVNTILDHVKTLNQPSRMCRKVLKTGDVLFSCNDCGLDATCVLCIDCFHKSSHKDHNYRMSTTDGGGCCDCGDIEAWKQHHACSEHATPDSTQVSLSEFEDRESRARQINCDREGILNKIALLPSGMAERYFLVCQASLHYARLMLNWDVFDSLPKHLEIDESEISKDSDLSQLCSNDKDAKNYFTVLFNDEVHTYDHVINTLVKIIKCTKMTASIMASTVSREGRSLVLTGYRNQCKLVRDAILYVRDSGQGPLKVEVIHGTVLAHQAFALKLIEWIQKMSLLCDAFRVLTAYTLLGNCDEPENSGPEMEGLLLEQIMLSNTTYWKMARVDWNDLFVTTLLTEYSIKEKFARLVTRLYPRLVQDFIADDHDHSVSVLTMTTQLYTVPSLVCMLIEEENALAIIMKKLIQVCHNTKREAPPIGFENRHTFDMQSLKRGFYIISDLRHLINREPTTWTEQLRTNVIEAVKIFLDLLESMQGMDSVKRQVGQHIEYEPEWETGMTLQSRLITFITRLVTYCSLDESVLTAVLYETQRKLLTNGGYKTVTRELFGHQVSCIQYDVSIAPVSVHLPLTRFAGALILDFMHKRPCDKIPYDENLVILIDQNESKRTMIDLMEPSLRTEVMIAQFRSGMWRRNGYSLVNQILYFSGAIMRREMYDRDILVLQECAATHQANEFMLHLLNKFNLFAWVSSETTREPLAGPKAVNMYNDEEIMTQTMSLGEEFLHLLLTIVGERFKVGVGKIQEEDVIKNEIIQLLCIGPMTRSELTQKLYVGDNELDCVKTVANLRRSTESSTGKYELKEEYHSRFNPFFYHYIRRHQSHALDAQLKRKRNLKEPLICCPPPEPVELTDQFRNLNELLKCDITLIIIQKILRRALGPPENSQECSTKAPIRFFASDLQLDQCLHLIGLGLYEQERNPLRFDYIEAAFDKDIFQLLKECHDKGSRSKDLILWLVKKTSDLIDKMSVNHKQEVNAQRERIYSTLRNCFKSILNSSDIVKEESKKRNSEMAAQRRERIMAMMKANQDKFLSNPSTKKLVAETKKHESQSQPPKASVLAAPVPTGSGGAATNQQGGVLKYSTRSGRKIKLPRPFRSSSSSTSPPSEDVLMDCSEEDANEDAEMREEFDQCDKQKDSLPIGSGHLCILCRDEQNVGLDTPTMVLLAYIQRSAVLSKNRSDRRIPNYALTPSNQLKNLHLTQPDVRIGNSPEMYSFTSDNSWSFDATFMPADLFFGPYISTCGHVMHYDCWRGFSDAVIKRETSRPSRGARHVSFELEKHELLCPLCECITNATIPLLPDFTRFVARQPSSLESTATSSGGSVFGSSPSTVENSAENLSSCLSVLRRSVDMFKHIRHIKEVSKSSSNLLSSFSTQNNETGKYVRLAQPAPINDVLEQLSENEALKLRDFITTIRGDKVSSFQCTKTLLSSISTLAERIHTVALDFDSSISDVSHSRLFMMTSWTISYSIQAHERASRFKGAPLFEDLESSKNLCLSSLLRFACSSMMTHISDMMQSVLVTKLRYLLINDEHLCSSPCILDIDAFDMFVSIFILLQKLYSHVDESSCTQLFGRFRDQQNSFNEALSLGLLLSTSAGSTSSSRLSSGEDQDYAWTTRAYDFEYFRNILHLMVVLNLVQVIMTMLNSFNCEEGVKSEEMNSSNNRQGEQKGEKEEETSSSLPTAECLALQSFYKEIIVASGHPNNELPAANEKLVDKVRCGLLPFLRSCAIFFYQLSHIEPDETLKTKSAFHEGKNFCELNNETAQLDSEAIKREFNSITHYLNLPSDFNTLLRSQEVRLLSRTWLHHSRVLLLVKSALNASQQKEQLQQLQKKPPAQQLELLPLRFIRQPHSVNRLIELPHDYSVLVDKVSDFTCPSIKNEDSRTPTICLVCGLMLCSQSYCCQRDLNDLASQALPRLETAAVERQGLPAAASAVATVAATAVGRVPSASLAAVVAITERFVEGRFSLATAPGASATASHQLSHIQQQLVGSCTYHAHECSGGVGIFLRIRNCQILLLSGRSKGCYMPAPYIDDHGETDFGLMRGNPLHLNKQHYERLQQMWMNHTIPEQISRTLEYSSYASNINWHLH